MATNKANLWLTIKNGIMCKCPNCGKGRIFKGYLTNVDCLLCGEKLGNIRAEDGPAWLTILIVGHILAPFLIYDLEPTWPEWLSILSWSALALLLIFLILPRAKGLFIAMIWRTQCSGISK